MTIAMIVSIAALPGVFSGVLGFLVHRDHRVPAPEQEDRQGHGRSDGGEVTGRERIEPVERDGGRVEGRAAGVPWTSAATTNQPSASTWKATSHTCSFSVASTSAHARHARRGGGEHDRHRNVNPQHAGEIGDLADRRRFATAAGQQEVDGDRCEIREHEHGRRDEIPTRRSSPARGRKRVLPR